MVRPQSRAGQLRFHPQTRGYKHNRAPPEPFPTYSRLIGIKIPVPVERNTPTEGEIGMNKQRIVLLSIALTVLVALALAFSKPGSAQENSWGDPSTDPHTLLIPRWFLSELTINSQPVPLSQLLLTLQFGPDGKLNGQGGCNDFFGSYQVDSDGSLTLGPIGATRMFCQEGMELENAYFQALESVSKFRTEQGKLYLSSADGKTTLVFAMPPK
jgi:heat shock protein HslJ